MSYLTPNIEFQKRYEERVKAPIKVGADSAYDAVMLLATAIRAVGDESTEKVATYLSSIKRYVGMSGTLQSDGKRGFTRPFILRKVVNGIPQTIPTP